MHLATVGLGRSRRLACFAAATLIVAGACGSNNATPTPAVSDGSPGPSSATSAAPSPAIAASPATGVSSGDPAWSAILADAVAHAGQPVDDGYVDRTQLLTAMGVPAALGADADAILELVAKGEAAVRAKQPLPAMGSSADVPGGSGIAAAASLAKFQTFESPYLEFRDFITDAPDQIGRDGPQTAHEDLGTQSNTQTAGGRIGTTKQHTVIDVVVSGSVVRVDVQRDIENTVTETATGAAVMSETQKHLISGQIDACPNAAGLVPASLEVSMDEVATISPGADGRAGLHASATSTRSSTFRGTDDDTATLGSVTQDYHQEEKVNRSADGGQRGDYAFTSNVTGIQDGVPANHDFRANLGDWSSATSTGDVSGDVDQLALDRIPGTAGQDYATMDQVYVTAQRVWRDTRCVIVTAPDYIPRSAFDHNQRPTHTEEVDAGSSTNFQVSLDHRFGQTVSQKTLVTIDGAVSIKPDTLPTPPGKLTYVAPDENGKDAHVNLVSTSRQGIGKLVLTFHTGTSKMQLSVSGTDTTSAFGVSYTTTFSLPKLVLELQPDGTYKGSGDLTATVKIPRIPCPSPFKEHGTLVLTAVRPIGEIANAGQSNAVKDESLPRKWEVTFDTGTKVISSGTCLGQSLANMLGLGQGGLTGGFMAAMFGLNKGNTGTTQAPYGILVLDADGGTIKVQKTVPIGASNNAINAKLVGKVISEGKH